MIMRLFLLSLASVGLLAQQAFPPASGGGAGVGTINTGTASCLVYYTGAGTTVDDIYSTTCRIKWNGTTHALEFYDSSDVKVAELDTDTGAISTYGTASESVLTDISTPSAPGTAGTTALYTKSGQICTRANGGGEVCYATGNSSGEATKAPASAYGAGWNGSNEPASKNDVYDKIETISGGSSTCFSASGLGYYIPFEIGRAATVGAFNAGTFGRMSYGFTPTCSMTFNRVTFYIDTASGTCGGTCGLVLAVYSSSGTLLGTSTVLTSGGTPNINATGAISATFATPVDLAVGSTYYLSIFTDSSVLTMYGTNTDGARQVLLNKNGSRVGHGTTYSGSGGSIAPASPMGTLTADSDGYGTFPMIVLENI